MFDEFEKPPDFDSANTIDMYPEIILILGIVLASYANTALRIFGAS